MVRSFCSFWGPDGTWDWEQDANQRWVLLQARERGASVFEAFSNSPPYWMTYSGRASGNRFAWLGAPPAVRAAGHQGPPQNVHHLLHKPHQHWLRG